MPEWLLSDTSLPQLLLRGTIVFFALLVLLRLVGQRESGGLSLSDLLVVVLVGNAAGSTLTGGGTGLLDGLVPAATVLLWSVAIDAASYRWPWLTSVIKGRPRPVITDGHLDRRALRREFITVEELQSQLRLHGLDDFSEVHHAYLEPNGELSIVTRDQAERRRRKDDG